MLILTRKSGERIRIGNDILIQPMKTAKGKSQNRDNRAREHPNLSGRNLSPNPI